MDSVSRARCARLAALAAGVVGGVFTAISVWWAIGGTWLLDTVGGSLERAGRERGAGILALLWATALIKCIASVLPLSVAWVPRSPRLARLARTLVRLEAVVLIGYGLIYTGAGLLVQAGAIRAAEGADGRALRWHTYLWDPWFLLWGVLVAVALRQTRPPRIECGGHLGKTRA